MRALHFRGWIRGGWGKRGGGFRHNKCIKIRPAACQRGHVPQNQFVSAANKRTELLTGSFVRPRGRSRLTDFFFLRPPSEQNNDFHLPLVVVVQNKSGWFWAQPMKVPAIIWCVHRLRVTHKQSFEEKKLASTHFLLISTSNQGSA